MNGTSQENTRTRYSVLPLIWGSFVVSIAIYAGITESIIFTKSEAASANITLYYAALGLAIVEILAIPVVKAYMSRLNWLASETPDFEEVKRAKQEKFVSSHIVAFAIAESVALYGFVLALQFHASRTQFYSLIGIAVIGLIMHYPSRTKWDTLDGTR